MSATGVFLPPALILPRKRMDPLLYKDAPNGTLPLISDTGYMNSHLFIDRLKHFLKHAEDPVLLIADNHTSHFSLPPVLFCRENHITFLTLPPHARHLLQQLDKCFLAPLKALYSSEAEKWLVRNPEKVTLAPLYKDWTVAVAPEEDEVSPSTSQTDASQSCHFLDMNNEEIKGK
ncbi:hypothetical protein AVEN_149853-1 [Araneus ventricosus]|uniref:DDE-1 domain-containing protein n=1 Tax=Araneus ventricosus TaxID=182803 RepID=A0A4Y2DWI1_ARAVE|nr:hypothetical protein AVEN_149853-1 [Araneus ventricosus]